MRKAFAVDRATISGDHPYGPRERCLDQLIARGQASDSFLRNLWAERTVEGGGDGRRDAETRS